MDTLPVVVQTFRKLNIKFFNTIYCPQWIVQNKKSLGDLVDIKTQCYVTAYALMYLLTGAAEKGWIEVNKENLDLTQPVVIMFDTDQHMAIYYNHCLYESFHKVHKLRVRENIQFKEIIENPVGFSSNHYGCQFFDIELYQSVVDISTITLDDIYKRYDLLAKLTDNNGYVTL